jgi:cytochrome c-type biogenesis protein CcmF
MTAELGHYALILSLAVALAQFVLPLWGAQRNDPTLMALGQPAALVQFFLLALSFACLTAAYVESDFSVVNVVQNSHSAKPLLYKISGVWGNHEGSLLLWTLILSVFGAALAIFGGNLPAGLRARALAIQAFIGVGFLLFMLLTSNPFLRVTPAPLDGQGLNPILQDPGLAFHPPMLYLGYVGFSMAFSFAIAALIEGRVDPAWARWVRPWTLAAWCFLTAGIALGSWWAYYELGWGGWWFWDPVENASFMPWLAGTALLHSAIVVEKRDALKVWTILLAILTFSLSLLGTFIVRSGVLNSVHSFAADPARGVFVLGFLVVVIGGSLALYALRAPALKPGGLFQPVSREGSLVLNNLLLAVACAAVLLGTLYPLFLDAVDGSKISVGPPYFNAVFLPLMTPLLVALGAGPLMAWKRADLPGVLQRLKFVFVVAVIAALAGWWLIGFGSPMPMLGIGLAAWLAGGALVELAERIRLFRARFADTLSRAAGLPRASWGMTVSHLGVAILTLGITVSGHWAEERQQPMKPGQTVTVGPHDYTLVRVFQAPGPNYMATRAEFRVTRNRDEVVTLYPETRRFTTPPMDTTEAGIRSGFWADLYTVVGEPDGQGGFATRIYFKPLVSWIWLGCLVMVGGGLLSLSDRRHRVGAPAKSGRTIAAGAAAE